jgi:hypothetical protein
VLPPHFVGRAFDADLLADLPEHVDPCGERGEFHTFVWDAPGFSSPIPIVVGEVVARDGFVFCDVLPDAGADEAVAPSSDGGDASRSAPARRARSAATAST